MLTTRAHPRRLRQLSARLPESTATTPGPSRDGSPSEPRPCRQRSTAIPPDVIDVLVLHREGVRGGIETAPGRTSLSPWSDGLQEAARVPRHDLGDICSDRTKRELLVAARHRRRICGPVLSASIVPSDCNCRTAHGDAAHPSSAARLIPRVHAEQSLRLLRLGRCQLHPPHPNAACTPSVRKTKLSHTHQVVVEHRRQPSRGFGPLEIFFTNCNLT